MAPCETPVPSFLIYMSHDKPTKFKANINSILEGWIPQNDPSSYFSLPDNGVLKICVCNYFGCVH